MVIVQIGSKAQNKNPRDVALVTPHHEDTFLFRSNYIQQRAFGRASLTSVLDLTSLAELQRNDYHAVKNCEKKSQRNVVIVTIPVLKQRPTLSTG